MAQFQFRLQKVLEYRELLEKWAKEAYLEARAKLVAAEQDIVNLDTKRKELLLESLTTLDDHIALEQTINSLDDKENELRLVVQTLLHDEEVAMAEWAESKRELEAMTKMREKAQEAWELEETRREQAALDEWASQRRKAAA